MKKTLTIAFILCALLLSAQNEDIDLEQFAERLFQMQDEDIAYEDIYESLLLFYTNKINLNKVDPEEIASLYILSPSQINSFFSYRDQFGNFLSINELQAIPGFDLATIRSLLPFVTISESPIDTRPFLTRVLTEDNNYFLFRWSRRLENQVGYSTALPLDTTFIRHENDMLDTLVTAPSRYKGSQKKIYGRFRTSHRDDFSIGFTFEKDNGERFAFNNVQKGFDFYSYHILLENKAGFEKIVIGDYQLQIGQGLVFGAGFSAGKGAETVNTVKRNSVGIRPYTSVLEGGFFRGIGLTKKIQGFEISAFYSYLKQDGNIKTDTSFSDFAAFINSVQVTGFHRTESELALKDKITEASIGGVLEYRPHRRLTIGAAVLNTRYNKPIQQRPNNYNQFEFEGDHNYITSGYINYTWQNFTLFGEGARSKSGGLGGIAGFVTSLSRTVDMAFAARNYEPDFHSFYGAAFSENSRNINERGTYWGISITPISRHKLNFYYDYFEFPWLKFRTEAPSNGFEYLARYTYLVRRGITLYAQIRQQNKQVTLPEGNLNVLKDQIKRNYIFNIDYQINKGLTLKTKIQASNQIEGGAYSKGFAIIQDINFDLWVFKFNTRMALFETENFDNAQYVYESDVLYAFSIPAYNGSGIRTYIMMRYDPMKKVSLWLRYAQFSFRDRTVVGSGLEQSNGSLSSELKIMMRVSF